MLSGAHRRSVAGESGTEVVAAIAEAAARPALNFRARRLPAKSFGNGRAAHLEILLGHVGKEAEVNPAFGDAVCIPGEAELS